MLYTILPMQFLVRKDNHINMAYPLGRKALTISVALYILILDNLHTVVLLFPNSYTPWGSSYLTTRKILHLCCLLYYTSLINSMYINISVLLIVFIAMADRTLTTASQPHHGNYSRWSTRSLIVNVRFVN